MNKFVCIFHTILFDFDVSIFWFSQVGNAIHSTAAAAVPDFTAVDKVAFPADGNPHAAVPTPPHDLAHTFKFKSYAPKIFHRLREFFDISASAYMSSVCGKIFKRFIIGNHTCLVVASAAK